jgi:outer membrane lipoprotein-sorting protein
MKKILFSATAVLLLSCGFADAQDASDIVKKSREKFRMAKSEIEEADISVKYDDGRVEQKTYTRWIMFDPAGEDKVSIVFSAPANDKGLGLLTWRHMRTEDDQWLKLPSLKQVRRVSTSDQAKYFAGTDITYEDARQLLGERTDYFNYQVLKKEGDVTVIEAKPKPETKTIYGKRVIWIDDRLAVVRVEYYSPEGSLIKNQLNNAIVEEKGCWRVCDAKIENILLKRSTTIKIIKRQIDTVIPANVFSKTFLEEKGR